MRPGVNRANKKIWECVLVYSDDLLVLALNPRAILDGVHMVYKLKAGSGKKPDQYLGADIGEMQLADGETYWYMSSKPYCKAALKNIETWLDKKGVRLPTKTACVFPFRLEAQTGHYSRAWC